VAEQPEFPKDDIPDAVAEPKKGRWSLVWLVPLIAILVGVGLVVRTVLERGPEIVVSFKTADGIEPGKTKVRYKNVEIGVVERVELAGDLENIKAMIRMSKSSKPLLVEDARFWVERPRVSGTNIEGLGTLLSGAYIGMDIGKSSRERMHFDGLERAPLVTFTDPGTHFQLYARQLGSLESGSQVYYRRVAVGQVTKYEMDKDGRGVGVEIFVKAPYDRFVNSATRFWEASGIDVELSAQGIRVDTQSLNTILSGGISFETRGDPDKAQAAEPNARFRLFDTKADAMKMEDLEVVPMRLVFNESVRGLSVGAPVDFRGVEVGRVSSIGGYTDQKQGQIYMTVDVDLFPNRLRAINVGSTVNKSVREGLDLLVAGGLRGQLRSGNLLSGQLLVSLDYFKGAPKAVMKWDSDPPIIPTIPGSLVRFEEQAADLMVSADKLLQSSNDLVKQLQALPLEKMSEDVRSAIQSLDSTLKTVDRQLSDDSMVQQDLRDTLREVAKAAAEARTLLEYQARYPETLIKGKSKEEQ